MDLEARTDGIALSKVQVLKTRQTNLFHVDGFAGLGALQKKCTPQSLRQAAAKRIQPSKTMHTLFYESKLWGETVF